MKSKNIKVFLGLIVYLVLCGQIFAQGYEIKEEKRISDEERVVRGDKLKGYVILPDVSIPVRYNVLDTLTTGTHHYLSLESQALGTAGLANFHTPWQSKVFFDRAVKPKDFIYLSSYEGLLTEPESTLFYDTRTPFTFIHYNKNFQTDAAEEASKGTLCFNIGKKINIGTTMHYTSSKGFYNASKSKRFRYKVFGSYQGDHYQMWSYIANDYYKMSENGGLTKKGLDFLLNPEKYSFGRVRLGAKDVGTQIVSESLFNRIRSGHGFLSHRYNFGSHQLKDVEITDNFGNKKLVKKNVFVPIANISHQFYYNKGSRRFIARSRSDEWATLFGQAVVKRKASPKNGGAEFVLPNDTAQLIRIKNTLALSLSEGFRPWVKFGLSAYVRAENVLISNPDLKTDDYKNIDKFYSLYAGGRITRYGGEQLNFDARGEVAFLGRDLGAFLFDGTIKSKLKFWNKIFEVSGSGHLENFRPSYFMEHQHGTYGWWDRSFKFSRRLDLSARLDLKSWGLYSEFRTASLQNHVYWDKNAIAMQTPDLIQVMMVRLGSKYKIGPFAWDFEAAYQETNKSEIIPLPRFIARGDVYFDFLMFRVLQIQLGVEAYWHSRYYTPKYMPTTQQFIPQDSYKIGGLPLMNAYGNFRLKGIRFYVRMYNLSDVLFKNNRLSSYLYPYNPMHLQAGIAVDLDR